MTSPEVIRPADVDALCEAVRCAGADQQVLEIRGGGSRQAFGAPRADVTVLSMAEFNGVEDYDPPELVITVGAGTPLRDVEELLAAEGQMLAFEPFDPAPVYGGPAGGATIGGMVAAATAGSRRLVSGSVRDHFLGFEAVSGRGERFVAGGRVVKNVTGYDLSKLMAGSWGQLAALTRVTLKVLPRPRELVSLRVAGLSTEEAVSLSGGMLRACTSVAAAAYVPAGGKAGESSLVLRLEGFAPSVRASVETLQSLLPAGRAAETLDAVQADRFWSDLRVLAALDSVLPLWRFCAPPSAAPSLARELAGLGADWLWDWAGGLVWTVTDVPADSVRETAQRAGGHATLVRAPEAVRRVTPAFHPQPDPVARLEERVRRSFDPLGVFECGRFRQAFHED